MLPARRYGLFSFLLSIAVFLMLLYGSRVFADWTYDSVPPVVTATCGASNTPLVSGGVCNGAYAKTVCTDPSPTSGCHSITHTNSSHGNPDPNPYVVNFSGPPYPASTSSQPATINSTGGTVTAIATDGAGNNSTPFTFTFAVCQIELGAGITVEKDTSVPVTATVTQGTVDSVSFSITNDNPAGSATVSPTSDSSSPYTTNVAGVKVGTATLNASGIVGGSPICSDTTPVTVTSAQGWWQVEDSDVLSSGNITSKIPAGCSGSCNPTFNLDGSYSNGYPGVTVYNGTANFGSGAVANPAWLANSPYNGPVYDYDWFAKFVPSEAFQNPITSDTIQGSNLSTGGYHAPNGYIWRYREGNLTINSTANLGSDKIILLVKNGNLTIDNNITLTDGTGFFAAIVQGNIILDPNVSHNNNPSLMGIYMADNQFKTGVGSGRLIVKGSVVGWGKTGGPGIVLERDLGASNSNTPAEKIIYDPSLSLTFPRELMRKGVTWKEVAP